MGQFVFARHAMLLSIKKRIINCQKPSDKITKLLHSYLLTLYTYGWFNYFLINKTINFIQICNSNYQWHIIVTLSISLRARQPQSRQIIGLNIID